MRNRLAIVGLCAGIMAFAGCTTEDRYTSYGAGGGAVLGGLAGQAIGRNTESTLIGAAIGTGVGAVAGNAAGRNRVAAEERAYRAGQNSVRGGGGGYCRYSDGVVRPCPAGY